MNSGHASADFGNILVRCPNWLGDVVMATPGLRALRARYPHARIVGHLPAALIPLLEGSHFCDELWPVASRGGGISGWRSDRARIADARFDLGLVIPESISSALLMRMGRVGRIVGFARDSVRRRLLHAEVLAPAPWGRRRWVSKERFVLTLMAAVGAEIEEPRLSLAVTPGEEVRLARILAEAGVDLSDFGRDPPVVIAPGASFGDAKCWPVDSYAALADRFDARGLPVVLIGAPGVSVRSRCCFAAPGGWWRMTRGHGMSPPRSEFRV